MIYKRDSINGQGETLTGDEIRLAYRMANSITSGGVTYAYSHMDGGEAVYKRSGSAPAQASGKPQPAKAIVDSYSKQLSESNLPAGAILHSDFVGRYLHHNGKRYRLMQPMTKCDGKFVYVPVEE